MAELFRTYPELEERIDRLCQGVRWCVTGVSALITDDECYYFEINKPKHWRQRADGTTVAGLGAIGGSLEAEESLLDCLHREVAEEICSQVEVTSADVAHLLYEQQLADSVPLEPRSYPRPVLCTISENLYRRDYLPDCGILAIITFWARLLRPPALGDLFGLVAVPRSALRAIFLPDEISLETLRQIPGARLETRAPLPDNMQLAPIWTGRSLQLLVQAGQL
ncbi:MAG: hypothetical protein GX552_06455 [Chloroflexi bacterium]|jgi:8-oxo-dGTP pyrophosphatase MutT (NUDIX family)|nr:hypothetical protein [Chloroflexota bacterium]